MEEPELDYRAKAAVRGYMLRLVAIPGVLVTVLSFVVGFLLRDVAMKTAEVEANKRYEIQLTQFVNRLDDEKVRIINDTAESREKAKIAAKKAEQLATETKDTVLKIDRLHSSLKSLEAVNTSTDTISEVVNVLKSDDIFLKEALKDQIDELKQSAYLECKTISKKSGWGHYPSVEITMSESDKNSEYVVVSGSCSVQGKGHNPPILTSTRKSQGWYCKAGDPPNIPLQVKITIEATMCRIVFS